MKFLKQNYLLIIILLVAIFFRFYQIKTFPGGLFPDEAANGLDINSIFKGDIQPFYERGNGREALFFYLLAASVSVFGRGPWQHHIVTGMVGVTEVLATYFLTKRLFGKNVALLASFFMACSSYAVMLNRNGFRANLIPLFTTLTFLFIVKFFQTPEFQAKSRALSALLAGLSFGLGFYTYISYRMMIPLLIGMGFLLWMANRSQTRELFRRYTKPKIIFATGFIIAFSWIGIYFIQHPGAFVGRAGQVSIFNKDYNHGDIPGLFLKVTKKTLLSFFTQGDLNWRHNVSGFPFLSLFLSPFFAISLTLFTLAWIRFLYQVLRQKLEQQTVYQALVAVWFWFMIVPEITTAEGIPHGLRLIGVIPPIFILGAWSVNKVWTWLKKLFPSNQSQWAFAAAFLGIILIYNYYLVFQIAAKSPNDYYAFRSDLTDVSKYLNERSNKSQTYLVLDTFSVQTVDYFTTTTNNPYILEDPAQSYKVNLKKNDQVVFTMSSLFDSIKFCQTHPTAKLAKQVINQFGLTAMTVYEQRNLKGDKCEPITNPGFNTNPTQQ
ncbi:MAG: glycosyltransferase family 39 protein [Candidatus Doudnabacteria bacterium]|nr:glycosyltransferase family 39 protein [Candidatus Doudnabacteria bacterium]